MYQEIFISTQFSKYFDYKFIRHIKCETDVADYYYHLIKEIDQLLCSIVK